MKNFTNKEISEFLTECNRAKEKGVSLTEIFKSTAKEYNISSGSVRNFYYKIVGGKEKLANEVDIPKRLKPAFIKEFSRAESKSVIKKILQDKSNGKSVRQSVHEMANGNVTLALRYQNKYRNALKNDVELVDEVVNELTLENGSCFNPFTIKNDENVKKIEQEINALILKIYGNYEKENEKLKIRLNELSNENAKLKRIIKNTLTTSGFAKEYFKNFENSNAK